jgi:tRNA modification GTPase
MYTEDTIAAIATPAGAGGIAVVRISGPDAERIARALFVRATAQNGRLKSHVLHYGTIRDPQTDKSLDRVLLTIMRRPRSYTGEDVVEVHCHGGAFVVRRILGLILAEGARHAQPGEFTKRAFLNGRVDLTQAEAVLDLITARTEKGADIALAQIEGELSNWVRYLREELIDICAQVEAAIDFPEEDIELLDRPGLIARINSLRTKITAISDTYEWGRLMREGATVCIFGRPNVGKSSLFNALLGTERVIVTPTPGTTRDVIEESINLDGLPVILWDTAGIRETADQVERIGVDRSLQHFEKSEAILVVLDGSAALTDDDRVFLSSTGEKKGLIAINKIDLDQAVDLNEVTQLAGDKKSVMLSAKQGQGVKELKRALRELILNGDREPVFVLTNLRHRIALLRGEQALGETVSALTEIQPTELVAVTLQQARESLEEVVGLVHSDTILESIFSKFCIGK